MALEETLWRAANKLRGQMDAAAYKHVVLGLVFLRHLSTARKSILRVPGSARWQALESVDAAMEAIEEANPALAGALPRGFDRLPRIGELLELVGSLDHTGDRDSLGRIYEYFLARFARAEGRRGGQFYTPRCVVRLLAAMLGPFDRNAVYDPCCGSGGMFVQSTTAHEVFGQESNPSTWRLARMNLALHGIEADLGPGPADTFLDDLHAGREADVVLANPPFNQRDWGAEPAGSDSRWRYGRPPVGNANLAWVQHILSHLAPGGVGGVVLANGSMSSTRAGEGAIRQAIVAAGWIDCIVALPSHLFFSTQIPACLWILSRSRPERSLFVDARAMGGMVERTRRELDAQEIARIADAYRAFREGDEPREAGFCAVAGREEIAARGCALSPALHVEAGPGRAVDPGRIERLAAQWELLATESARLTNEIRETGLGRE
jgi:type I restriction enzyme M protein